MVQGRSPYRPRLLLALIEQLPEDSAFVTSVRGRDWRGWTRQAAILADLYDAVMSHAAIAAADYSQARKVKPIGKPYPRPTTRQRAQRVADVRRALGGVARPDLVAPPPHAIPSG
ncbi:hypothetical protein BJF83_17290 [Nocardiopsis sp. CNR-923]|uniref:hypothetical protein n=1 Tax=Nocardiopsis sp. CNR-923 TaxID=1904965 RepID=UPI0009632D72|nr:hypothetical protein [Nocardiopsis sp. CNR-923]OLT27741.1 hypothetical protein BJF83_17290 [Nocardiopsis sp. CNR-923]